LKRKNRSRPEQAKENICEAKQTEKTEQFVSLRMKAEKLKRKKDKLNVTKKLRSETKPNNRMFRFGSYQSEKF